MAFNARFPDGRDLELVIPRRISSPTTMTGVRGPDGQDAAMWFEKVNGAGTLPFANIRNTSGQDFSALFTASASVIVSASGNEASYNNGNNTTPTTRRLTARASATAIGGTGGYTYLWEVISNNGVTSIVLSNPNDAITDVTGTATLNFFGTVTLRCTVTSGSISGSAVTDCRFNYYNNV